MEIHIGWDKARKQGIIEYDNLDLIREHFSVDNPTAAMQKRFNPHVPSRFYAITTNGRFDVGLFPNIYRYLQGLGIPFKVTTDPEFDKHLKPSYSFHAPELNIQALNIPYRDYQEESIRRGIAAGRGVFVLATAAGKTLTMAGMIETIHTNEQSKKKTFIIVPNIQLVNQTYSDFIEYGIDASRMTKWCGGNEPNFDTEIIIAGTQILMRTKEDLDIFKDIDLLIVDEVHVVRKANEINKVLKKIKTNHRFGFTGTLPDEQLDSWHIIGKFGPILYEKTSADLRDGKFIAQVESQVLEITYHQGPNYSSAMGGAPTAMYEEELSFIHSSDYRNGVISKISSRTENNTLVLVDRIVHGEKLLEAIQAAAPHKVVRFIQGDVEVADREVIRKMMETQDNVVCIAVSKIFSTGVNIKNIHFIIFASAGKAKIKTLQSIGRGLRLHPNKEKLTLIDIADNLYYGKKHLEKRIALYEKEKIPLKRTGLTES